jgi:hypothetical protein
MLPACRFGARWRSAACLATCVKVPVQPTRGTTFAPVSTNGKGLPQAPVDYGLKPEAAKMFASRVEFAALRVYAALSLLLLFHSPAHAADYTVKRDGTGTFTSVQACANAAKAGDTCLVYPGTYPEHVATVAGGTSETARIVFKAQGAVTIQGFNIRHPYMTVEGFDITGDIAGSTGMITVFFGGNYCQILNNVLRDGSAKVAGLVFYDTGGQAASNCIVRGNRLSNLLYVFMTITGDNHLFEGNTLERQNSQDYLRLFGANHIFRRNVFWRGTTIANTGNHPDFVQTFGSPSYKSENHLFEENWIQDLPSQFSQINSGDGQVSNGVLYNNVKNVVFRKNIISSVSLNANVGMPGVRFENNTFYRLSYEGSGITIGGSLTRGDASRTVLRNNVFLEGGFRAAVVGDSAGFYSMSGANISREVIGAFVTNDPMGQTATSAGIYNDLNTNGYINSNGQILPKASALTAISQFVLNAQYAIYRTAVFDTLMKTVSLDRSIRTTFLADYNFVAGAASVGFPAKKSNACDPLKTFTDFNFCEPHGINGGNPQFRNLANPLGADGIPFTLDDGLKPLQTSPMCGNGENANDIGAYSCDPMKVFADGTVSPPPVPPLPPANLRIVH